MLHDPNPFVKTKTNKQQKESRQQKLSEEQKQSKQQEDASNEAQSSAGTLYLEEQLDLFAEVLIDLYLLDQQPTRHEEN